MTLRTIVDRNGNREVRPVCSGCGKVMDCSVFSDCYGDDDHEALLDDTLSPYQVSYEHYHRACVPNPQSKTESKAKRGVSDNAFRLKG